MERLYANGRALEAPLVELSEGLPEPVERYFEFAPTAGQPLVRHVFIRWRGESLMFSSSGWRPFSAEQHFSGNPPGYVWDARVLRAAPFLPVPYSRQLCRMVPGASEASVASLVPLKGQRGTREVAEASLMRYLAEAAWLPTAPLPRPGLSWSAIDADTARATLTDRGARWLAVDFRFGAAGEIVSCSADCYRAVGGGPALTPWRGDLPGLSADRRHDGADSRRCRMGPVSGPPTPVWRGHPTDIEYTFAETMCRACRFDRVSSRRLTLRMPGVLHAMRFLVFLVIGDVLSSPLPRNFLSRCSE